MFAITNQDIVTGMATGDASGALIPVELRNLDLDQLRYDGASVVDGSTYTAFYIDPVGQKHIIKDNPGWQTLACAFDDDLILDAGLWRVRDGNDDLILAKGKKKIAIQAEKKRIRDGGVTVDGVLFDTDIPARVSYQDFALRVAADPAYAVPDWKASENTFVTMDAPLYAKVMAAGEQLLTDIFAWQRQQNTKVDAATTQEDLETINTVFNP